MKHIKKSDLLNLLLAGSTLTLVPSCQPKPYGYHTAYKIDRPIATFHYQKAPEGGLDFRGIYEVYQVKSDGNCWIYAFHLCFANQVIRCGANLQNQLRQILNRWDNPNYPALFPAGYNFRFNQEEFVQLKQWLHEEIGNIGTYYNVRDYARTIDEVKRKKLVKAWRYLYALHLIFDPTSPINQELSQPQKYQEAKRILSSSNWGDPEELAWTMHGLIEFPIGYYEGLETSRPRRLGLSQVIEEISLQRRGTYLQRPVPWFTTGQISLPVFVHGNHYLVAIRVHDPIPQGSG